MCFSVEQYGGGPWRFFFDVCGALETKKPCGSRGLFATLLCIMTIASIGLLAWCLRDVLQHMNSKGLGLDKSTILGSVTELVQQIAMNCNPI